MTRTDTVRFAARQLDKLSGGERQRVVLARALVQQAGVILLDEPSSSLDLRFRLSIMETLREEIDHRQVVVVVALHDISLASRYCDRLALLSEGVIDSVSVRPRKCSRLTISSASLPSTQKFKPTLTPDVRKYG